MEELINLKTTTKVVISNLDAFVFENKKEYYSKISSIIEYMRDEVAKVERVIESNTLEKVIDAKMILNTILTKCDEITRVLQSSNNFVINIDENGEIIAREATPDFLKSEIDKVNTPSNGIVDAQNEQITIQPSIESSEIIPEAQPTVITDSNFVEPSVIPDAPVEQNNLPEAPTVVPEVPQINVFSQEPNNDLDVNALNSFLTSENPQTLTLNNNI